MKILGIIGVVVGIVALLMGVYLEFSVAPAADSAALSDEIMSRGDAYWGSAAHVLNTNLMDAKLTIGQYTLLVGGGALLLSIVPAIKKQKIAWIGVVCGLFALLIGAAYGTHLFS